MRCLLILIVIHVGLAQSATANGENQETKSTPPADDQIKFFETQVAPILQAHCFKCHGGQAKIKAGLRLTSRDGILQGGDTGPAVLLQKPAESLLLNAINYVDYEMPPSGKLQPEQIAVLTRWVKMGVPFSRRLPESFRAHQDKPDGPPRVSAETMKFWSFQRVQRPRLPSVHRDAWVTNPIDAFILSKLESAGLEPCSPAGKVALLRRAYYDLTGLPPSPEDVRHFITDDSADAYERVIDRLLDSPQYGEKWARHWLDLVRYAETNSYERDGAKPFVWRYRDYIIRSFNEDKPYDQFIREQLAGDELPKVTADSIIATGFYRLGIWDDEPSDPEQALYDDLDDILSTTAQVFLGMTIGCARCHDHKLDPIPQKDYYSMLAFLRNIRRYGVRAHETVLDASVRTIDYEQEQELHAREVELHRQQMQEVEQQLVAIEKSVRHDFTGVEKDEFQNERARVPILRKRVPKLLSQQRFKKYTELTKRRNVLRRNKPPGMAQALCVKEHGSEVPATHILVRGSARAKGSIVEPAFPAVLGFVKPEVPKPKPGGLSSNRRMVLANWIASPRNPLTARVIANRVWQHHFGRGIVRSPSNFGMRGQSPTHRGLLDWLASEFISSGWKFKAIHKLIMLSSAYRMSSKADVKSLQIDPQNDLFWRFNPRRLSAEEIRDSILAVNGSLNHKKMFGPSVYTVIPQEVLAGQSRPGAGWGKSSVEDRNRRSIYVHIKRSLVVPIMANFDVADTDLTCPVRFNTTQPSQALGMLNSELVNRQARVFAEFLRSEAGADIETQVTLCLQRTLQREPSEQETARGVQLILALQKDDGTTANDALQHFCLIALNLNEFIYLD